MAIEAEFRSKCSMCGEWIEEGDKIVQDDDENWVHQDCVDPKRILFNMTEESR